MNNKQQLTTQRGRQGVTRGVKEQQQRVRGWSGSAAAANELRLVKAAANEPQLVKAATNEHTCSVLLIRALVASLTCVWRTRPLPALPSWPRLKPRSSW